jgi:hypothetical protein
MMLTRRALLVAATAWAAMPGCSGPAPSVTTDDLVETAVPLEALLAAWFGDGALDGVAELGLAHLDGFADAEQVAELNALLTPIADLGTAEEVVAAWEAAVAAELEAGEIADPAGWLLPHTEARLTALAWVTSR